MRTFNLQDWQIHIENKGTDKYRYVCDAESLIILDSFHAYVTLVCISENENLVLEHLPYWIHYKVCFSDKVLFLELD